jgi:hypothetical protein
VELFHLLGHLLWYCSASADDSSSQKRQKLLNEIILLAGYPNELGEGERERGIEEREIEIR